MSVRNWPFSEAQVASTSVSFRESNGMDSLSETGGFERYFNLIPIFTRLVRECLEKAIDSYVGSTRARQFDPVPRTNLVALQLP